MASNAAPPQSAFPVEAIRSSGLHGGMAASRRLNYIYVQNWKCGSSTVRSTLWAAEHELGLAAPPENPHKPSRNSPFIADPRRWERVDAQFVFTIARNPYIRVLSAYLDKIHGHRDQKVWGKFSARHGLTDRALSFEEFLRIVADTPDNQMDPHWRPQNCNLVPAVIPYNFIGSLETFDSDLSCILSCIFPDRPVPIRDHKPHQTGSASKLAEYYGPAEIRLVQAIYERDFLELGYDLDLASTGRLRPPERPDTRIVKAWGRAWRLVDEERYAAAEQQFVELRRWIAGATVEEQLLRCRCELSSVSHSAIEQSVHAAEQALRAGQDEWSLWKWYGHGLVRLRRWEDGLEALLSATERHTAGGVQKRRTRRLIWRLALVRASKGRLEGALATFANSPTRPGPPKNPRVRAARRHVRRGVLRVVASLALALRAPRWHPDRSSGIPSTAPGAVQSQVSSRVSYHPH